MSGQEFTGLDGKERAFCTIVIGGGQAGLAMGYFLKQMDEDFVILDENQQTGASWRNRWDSLRLFTPGKLDSLPGKPFPGAWDYCPTKDEVADYLEDYVRQFNLPVRHGVKVESLKQNHQGYQIFTNKASYTARNVVIATGPYQIPSIPQFASHIDPAILQLHSSNYCHPQQIHAQTILVVGAGNSGSEIALELAKAGKQVWLAGEDVGNLPINTPLGRAFKGQLAWWMMRHVLTVDTPIGRRVRSKMMQHGAPLGRIHRVELAKAGVKLTKRVADVQDGKLEIEGGQVLPVEAVIWATGFRPDYRWINLPIFDERGLPRHSRGVVETAPGLYFLGLLFQSGLTSSLLGGVDGDAAYLARQIARTPIPA